jgi:hypothetical protein
LADGDQRAGTRNSPEKPRPNRSAGVRAAPPNVTNPRRAAAHAEGATAAAGEETAAAEVAMRGRRREARGRAEVVERRREAKGCGVGSEAGAVFVAVVGHG